MRKLLLTLVGAAALLPAVVLHAQGQWNVPGLTNAQLKAPSAGPAPRRDLAGVWDAGGAGIGGSGQADEREKARAPFTKLGEER
jgi:hypothetical protein